MKPKIDWSNVWRKMEVFQFMHGELDWEREKIMIQELVEKQLREER